MNSYQFYKKALIAALFLSVTIAFVPAGAQIISTVAGTGTGGYSGDGGTATAAQLNSNWGMTVDGTGNIYVSDFLNHRVRKIDTFGIITTFAGNGSIGFSGDSGPATNAQIINPTGIGVDGTGNVYVVDFGNGRIRKISTSGIITTVAGGGSSSSDGIPATNAGLGSPNGIAVDHAGNLYIPNQSDFIVRKVNTSGIITTVAGNGISGFSGDGGPATNAQIGMANDVSVDNAGNLYISDWANNRIRIVNTSGIISTYAGNGAAAFSGDGGQATAAAFTGPMGVDFDASGNVVICDVDNHRIRSVSASGIVNTIAGTGSAGASGDGGPATAAALNRPVKVAFDSRWNMYISDRDNHKIRKVAGCNPTIGVVVTAMPGDSIIYGSADTFTATVTNGGSSISYQWLKNGVNIAGATNATYISSTLHNNDTITCKVIGNPCTTTHTGLGNHIIVHVRPGLSIAEQAANAHNICIYPNPNNGSFSVYIPAVDEQNATITVTNIVGQKIDEVPVKTNTESIINIHVVPGVYFLTTITQNERFTTRIVITK